MDRTELDKIANEIITLIVKKNSDYGDSYSTLRSEFGKVAFVIRIADKLSRLKSLLRKPQQVEDESDTDTIKDIIGYCLLELLYRRKQSS